MSSVHIYGLRGDDLLYYIYVMSTYGPRGDDSVIMRHSTICELKMIC